MTFQILPDAAWNPVKELKGTEGPKPAAAQGAFVESGEGIERLISLLKLNLNSIGVESGEGIERRFRTRVWRCVVVCCGIR